MRLAYSYKANRLPGILRTLAGAGTAHQVASEAEYRLARRVAGAASGSVGGLPTDRSYAVAFAVAAAVTGGALLCAVAIRRPATAAVRAGRAVAQLDLG